MKLKCKKKTLCLLLLALVLMALVWPANIIRQESPVVSGGTLLYQVSEALSADADFAVEQYFRAQHEYLNFLSLDLKRDESLDTTDTVEVSLWKADGKDCMMRTNVPLSEIEDGCYFDVPVKAFLEKGEAYVIRINAAGCEEDYPCVYYTWEPSEYAAGSEKFLVNGTEIPGAAVVRYGYESRLSIGNILALWLAIGVLVLALSEWKGTDGENDRETQDSMA